MDDVGDVIVTFPIVFHLEILSLFNMILWFPIIICRPKGIVPRTYYRCTIYTCHLFLCHLSLSSS